MGRWTEVIDGTKVFWAWGNHGEYVLVAPGLDVVVARFGRQFGSGAPRRCRRPPPSPWPSDSM